MNLNEKIKENTKKKRGRMTMKKLKKNVKGITLIALVVTIIVLLILAAVAINLTIGNNGIFTRAQNASIKTGRANVIEQARIDIMGKQIEEGSANLIKANVKEVLDKYFENVQDNFTLDTLLHTKEEYGEYDIKVSEIYNGTLAEISKTAKEVLKVNPEATEAKDKSPYIKYNGMLCRVLYSDETHGIQIITADNGVVPDIELGYRDEKVVAEDFVYEGTASIDDNFKKAAASYNNAVDNLNETAKEYMDKKGIAIDARCLGSIAIPNEENKFKEDTTEMYSGTNKFLTTYSWNGKFKNKSNNYEEDTNQINLLGINATYNFTWLASHSIGDMLSREVSFGIPYLVSSGSVGGMNVLLNINSDGSTEVWGASNGFRPVFLISPDAIISSGDGSSENPYVIE